MTNDYDLVPPMCAFQAQYDATSEQRESIIPSRSSRNKHFRPPPPHLRSRQQGASQTKIPALRDPAGSCGEQNT